jgi:threonine/homoserine/homoserine lactone efflux protein
MVEATIFYTSLVLVNIGHAFMAALAELPQSLFLFCGVRGIVWLAMQAWRKETCSHKESSHDTTAAAIGSAEPHLMTVQNLFH